MATVPVATTANSEYSPRATLKPANRNVASDGIGMHALSATIRTKMPGQAEGVDDVDREVDERVGDRGEHQHGERSG